MHARASHVSSHVMAQFVLKIEKLFHIIGTAPILEMVRTYSLRPRLQLLLLADEEWGKNEKKHWVEKVGEKKMAAVFHAVINVGGAGRLLVSLPPFKVNMVASLG